ncbi:MAG: phosphoglycerate dehydrogenase, partial [Eggerthellaceae bacterium]|nr:phosphoglycerate dehydrogenase [Eggerthellaceae bacterium]
MAPKKILVTDHVDESGLSSLRSKGYEVDEKTDLGKEELIEAIADYDALIVRSATTVDSDVIDAAKNLKVIGRAGVTTDNIDVECAVSKDIVVCNAPVSNIVSAAEHTMALLLACARKIPQANESMHEGKWERQDFLGVELMDKTLAIIGLGKVGGLVAERAQGFGMNLIGYDPYCSPERAQSLGVSLVDDLDEVCSLADFITVHLPKTPETIGMFGPDQFAAMRDGVIIVNTATAGIFQENVLADFLAAGKVRGAGVDVFAKEPCHNSALQEFGQAILTPHIASLTKEAQVRASSQIAEYVWEGLEGSIVPTALNNVPLPPDIIDVVGPFIPACQVTGRIISQLIEGIPKSLTLVLEGLIANSDPSILLAASLDGILSY